MEQIKTTLLLGFLTGFVLWIGYAIAGQNGLFVALLLSLVMNIGAYWFSDKIVLGMYHAQPVSATSHPDLFAVVQDMSLRASLPMPRLYIIDIPVPNAFATGRNPEHSAVAVSTSLLTTLSRDELKAVIAHELGHIKNKDILISSVAAALSGAVSYLVQFAYMFGGGDDRKNNTLVQSLALLIVTPLIATLIQLAISRSREYLADARSKEWLGTGEPLIAALQKIEATHKHVGLVAEPKNEATAHLFIANPFVGSRLFSFFSTHPSLEDRIARLRQ